MRRECLHVIVLTVLLTGVLGCQSTMEAKVERIQPLPRDSSVASSSVGKRIPGASNGEAVGAALVALEDYRFSDVFDAIKKVIGDSDSIKDDDAALRADSQELVERGEELREKGDNIREEEAREFVLDVRTFLVAQRAMLRQFARGYQPEVRERISEIVDSRVSTLDGQIAGLTNALSRGGGFGGFRGSGIYLIDPADPAYEAVLNGTVSGQPLSSVKGTATGESVMIFVQESPAQMRAYNMDVDATKLIKSIAGMTDKALAAWANYMTAGTPVVP